MKNRDIILLPVRNLRPNRRNARTHPKKQIKQIIESIRRFGWTYPILADENGTILAGHGRYLAALELGLPNVPVMTLADLSQTEKRALALADNKVALNAGWDRELLARELGELLTCCRSAASMWRSLASSPPRSTACSAISSILSSIPPTMLLRLRGHL